MTVPPISEKMQKLRDDGAAISDELILTMIGPRLPDFCQWCWPEGEVRANFFYPAESLPDRISLTGDMAGTYWLQTGYRVGTIIDRLRADGLDPFDIWRDYLHSLPEASTGTRAEAADARLDGMICPAAEWNCIEPPKRRWIVRDWLPVGNVTSLYGGPGVGKTLIAQQLATSVATGRSFFGLETMQAPALVIACEDDRDELHRRQFSICATSGVEMHKLGLLSLVPRAGRQNVLASFSNGIIQLMPLFQTIRETARSTGAKLIVIDNIAQCFAGNENIRAEVTAFVNALGGLALELDAAVLLLGHPGKASNSEYSGSTAWDAAVRSRWILERPKPDLDDEEASELADLRVLRKAKANYSGTGDEIPIRWEKGAFRPEGGARIKDAVDRIEEHVQEKAENTAFVAGLHTLLRTGFEPSFKVEARSNFAPKLLKKAAPECHATSVAALRRAMDRLLKSGEVVLGWSAGPPSRRKTIIVPKGHDFAQGSDCASEDFEHPTDTPSHCPDDAFEHPTDTYGQGSQVIDIASSHSGYEHPTDTYGQGSQVIDIVASDRFLHTPLYTTYIEGGTLGAVPPSEDTEAAELSRLYRITDAADQLEDLSARLAEFDWLKDFKPEAPDLSRVELLRKVEA
jgi:RecA-family ATPase